MSTKKRDRQEERLARWRHEFREHRATLRVVGEGDDRVELLTWAKPGTGIHRINYMTHGPRLVVTGDLYDAVYNRASGLAWWASLGRDFGYFASKCEASPEGRHYREWDAQEARDGVAWHLSTYGNAERRRYFFENDGKAALHSEMDWIRWLDANGHEAFGSEYWEVAEVGKRVSWQCEVHLLGLQMAMAQLADVRVAA